MMKFPTEWKVTKFHGSSHHQPVIVGFDPPHPHEFSSTASSSVSRGHMPYAGCPTRRVRRMNLQNLPTKIRDGIGTNRIKASRCLATQEYEH